MLCDNHYNYRFLFAFPDTSAEHAARAILDWCAAFGVPALISDGPMFFKNETFRVVVEGLQGPRPFTLPQTLWSNGRIERLGKELLRVIDTVMSTLRLVHGEWMDLLPLVQSEINNVLSPRRASVLLAIEITGIAASSQI